MEPDREFEELLYEIPRATSAPPHVDCFSSSSGHESLLLHDLRDVIARSSISDSCVQTLQTQSIPSSHTHNKQYNLPAHTASFSPRMLHVLPPEHSLPGSASFGHSNIRFHQDRGDQSALRNAMVRLSLRYPASHYAPADGTLEKREPVFALSAAGSGNDMLQDHRSMFLKSTASCAPFPCSQSSILQPSLLESSHASLLGDGVPLPAMRTSPSWSVLSADSVHQGPVFLGDDVASKQSFPPQAQQHFLGETRFQGNVPWQAAGDASSTSFLQHRVDIPSRQHIPGLNSFYENRLLARPGEFRCDAQVTSFIQQQKMQLAMHATEERLQPHPALNASFNNNQMDIFLRSARRSFPLEDLKTASFMDDRYCRFCPQGRCIHGPSSFLHSQNHGQHDCMLRSFEDAFTGTGEMRGTFSHPAMAGWQKQLNFAGLRQLASTPGGRQRKDDVKLGACVNEKLGACVNDGDSGFSEVDKAKLNGVDYMKLISLDDVEGQIYTLAKDQHGCRFLQRKLDETRSEDVEKIFKEINDHVVELMTDPFGNYLVQKLLDICNEAQRTAILEAVTKNNDLVNISLNMHGTRAVQKLIEILETREQISMVISSLKHGVVMLMKDLNGNHVVQRCLQRLNNEDTQFIFDVAASHCVEIASHRHGCCVLQRCVDFASGFQRENLVSEIASNSLELSQDPFGNYVVQYILDLGLSWASTQVMSRLEGSYSHLAMQKFSSNVIEKCLKVANEESKSLIITELVRSSELCQLLQDPYANYVIQSALQVTKGYLHTSLIDAIKPHLHVLRSSPYGKRILSRTQLKK